MKCPCKDGEVNKIYVDKRDRVNTLALYPEIQLILVESVAFSIFMCTDSNPPGICLAGESCFNSSGA